MYKRKIKTVAVFLLLAVTSWAQGPNDSGTYYQEADGAKGRDLKTLMYYGEVPDD